MKREEVIYSGEPVPPIREQEHPDFYLQLQRVILARLKDRELLTEPEYVRCIEDLEKLKKPENLVKELFYVDR